MTYGYHEIWKRSRTLDQAFLCATVVVRCSCSRMLSFSRSLQCDTQPIKQRFLERACCLVKIKSIYTYF